MRRFTPRLLALRPLSSLENRGTRGARRAISTHMLSIALALSLAATYELADLKALEKQQSWAELVEHLADITPSKRDKDWEGLAERGGAGWLGTLETKDASSSERALEQADGLIKKFGFLKSSKTYMSKRTELALKAFKQTFSNYRHSAGDDEWMVKVKAFAESDPAPELPLKLAKEVVLPRLVAGSAFPLFKLSFERGNKTLCKDSDFQKMLVDVMEDGSWKTEASEMTNKCWDDVKGPLTSALEKTKSGTYRRSVCPLLAAKNALPAAQKEPCDIAAQ